MKLSCLLFFLICCVHHGNMDSVDPTEEPKEPSTSVPNPSQKEEGLHHLCPEEPSSQQIKRLLAGGVMNLGLMFLQHLKPSSQQPNVLISPIGLSAALAQLALGATGETEDLLLHHLRADALPCYHQFLGEFLRHYRKKNLTIASRLYLRSGFQVKPEFLEESRKLYDSVPASLVDVNEVNDWVQKATDGLISEFASSLPSNTIMMLISAMHYKGEWTTRFQHQFTSIEPFFLGEDRMVNTEMMLGPKYPLSVFTHHDLDAQIARFPFKGDKSLLVVMPTSGRVNVSAIATNLNVSDIYARLPPERNMQVKLPKFKLDFSQDLQEAMISMGLGSLFSKPSLERISESFLFLSSVQHMSTIEVNEDGGEAAAATSVFISRSSPAFIVNQPFFFALIDDLSHTPFFLGVITNPNPGASTVSTNSGYADKMGFSNDKQPLFPK